MFELQIYLVSQCFVTEKNIRFKIYFDSIRQFFDIIIFIFRLNFLFIFTFIYQCSKKKTLRVIISTQFVNLFVIIIFSLD